ncbi:MAG: hypothetical protein HY301_21075 [Verrucomicrobia bacterium]|nr:hypothetical protein [Verrucomicrobiota bacterium]
MQLFVELRNHYPHFFPPSKYLHPIPFFGDIRQAEVLTVALNPSHAEFSEERYWHTPHSASQLTTRLIHYFDLPDPAPHRWFDPLEKGLLCIGSSYDTNTAHVDVCPYPTWRPREMQPDDRPALHLFLQAHVHRLSGVLSLCTRVKFVLLVDYPGVVVGAGQAMSRWVTNTENFGHRPPFLKLSYQNCSDWLFDHRKELREFLSRANTLNTDNHA